MAKENATKVKEDDEIVTRIVRELVEGCSFDTSIYGSCCNNYLWNC